MTGDIVLSGALRTNPKSLTKTEILIAQTNLRLSLGKKYIKDLDSPQAFFAASALSNEAFGENLLALLNRPPLSDDALTLASQSQRLVLELFSTPIENLVRTGDTQGFFSELEKITGPLMPASRWLLITILWPVLIGVLGNLATTPVQNFLSRSQPDAGKVPPVTATEHIEPSSYRFAMSEGVRIRKAPASKAEVVSRMHRGQMVRVMKNQGSWLLVELKSGDTKVVGWTYANTLGKFSAD